ncbi:MAG TPA: metal ABC transporter permease [Acidimicrobiia bacterium]|nr:metal ABC transporter permease [Acidimicrobiia bacterium]
MTPLLAAWPGPLSHDFFRQAFVAGTAAAVAAGLVGAFLVLRNQVFAGDALSHVAFTGGLAALAFGFAARTGVFAATVAAAIVLAALGGRARLNDVVTGVVFTWLLGLGVLFLTIFTASQATTNGTGAIRVLFGSIFGVSGATATQTMLIAAGVVVAMVGIGRPLLFASIDPAVAEARGVPVTTLNVVFLAAVGIMVAQLVQVVGALLLLGLITTPAATAQRLTARPWRAVGASVAIAVATVWVGLWLGYVRPTLPPSTAIIGTGFLAWLAVELGDRTVLRHTRPPKPAEQPAP